MSRDKVWGDRGFVSQHVKPENWRPEKELAKALTARLSVPPQAPDFRNSHGVSGWRFEPVSPYGRQVGEP